MGSNDTMRSEPDGGIFARTAPAQDRRIMSSFSHLLPIGAGELASRSSSHMETLRIVL